MGSSNTWAIDHEAAHRFLALLGKDPATTRLRAFPHRDDPRRQQIGARKGVWNLRQAERWARQGRGVYVVINDGGDRNSAIQSCRALFVEWDDQPIAWQGQAWRELGLPEPTVIVASGGRSLHCYWVLREPVLPAAWRPLQRELIEKAQGDRSCCDLARVMRLPGSWYLDAQGQPLARASIEAASGQRYGADELAAALLACRGLGEEAAGFLPVRHGRGDNHLETALAPEAPPLASDSPVAHLGSIPLLPPAKHPTAPTDMTSPATPAPTWSDICSALAAIPPRVAGSNTYGVYRNILWGLISATEEAGHQKEEAIALMEAHSPSGESGVSRHRKLDQRRHQK